MYRTHLKSKKNDATVQSDLVAMRMFDQVLEARWKSTTVIFDPFNITSRSYIRSVSSWMLDHRRGVKSVGRLRGEWVTTLLQTITERDKPAKMSNYELRRLAHIWNSSFHGYKRGCCNCRLRIYASIRSRVGWVHETLSRVETLVEHGHTIDILWSRTRKSDVALQAGRFSP